MNIWTLITNATPIQITMSISLVVFVVWAVLIMIYGDDGC